MSTDTRHPQYDDATLQAAIETALIESDPYLFITTPDNRLLWEDQAPARLALARGLLARLPEPQPPTADGKTPGEVYQEILHKLDPDRFYAWSEIRPTLQQEIEQGASAVLAAFGGTGLEAAIARMEAVPVEELDEAYGITRCSRFMEAVRAHLIAAAREGQPAAVDWKAKCEKAESYIKKMDSIIEEVGGVTVSCINPYEDLKRCVTALKQRSEKAEAELAMSEAAFSNYRGLILSTLNEVGAPTHHPDVGASARKPMTPQERIKALCGLSTLPTEAKAPAVEAAKPAYVGYMTDEMPVSADPYAELKAAHGAGKVIQWNNGQIWIDHIMPDNWEPIWIHPTKDYRIKPASTFTAHGKTWNVHVPGDPMPCHKDAKVNILTQGDTKENALVWCRAFECPWEKTHGGWQIIGWRYADEPTPAPPPWQPAVGEPVRLVSGGWPMVVGKVEADIDRITTVWMDSQGQPQQASYPAACLVSAKEAQP